MESFGDRLRFARKQKNIKQVDLANQLKVAKSTISNWERNSNKPDIDQLSQVCDVLGVTADYLIGYSKESFERESIEYFKNKVDELFERKHHFADKKYSECNSMSKIYADVICKSLDYGGSLVYAVDEMIFFTFVYINDLFYWVDKTNEEFANRDDQKLKSEYLKINATKLIDEIAGSMEELIDYCCSDMPHSPRKRR